MKKRAKVKMTCTAYVYINEDASGNTEIEDVEDVEDIEDFEIIQTN